MLYKKKKLYIFDFGNTLFETRPPIIKILVYLLTDFNFKFLKLKFLLILFLYFIHRITSKIFGKMFILKFNKLSSVNKFLIPNTNLIKKLKLMRSNNIKIAIYSDTEYNEIIFYLKNSNTINLFDLVLGKNSLEYHKKPSKFSLQAICMKLGEPVDNAVFIGNSDKDFYSAKLAYLDFININNFYSLFK